MTESEHKPIYEEIAITVLKFFLSEWLK